MDAGLLRRDARCGVGCAGIGAVAVLAVRAPDGELVRGQVRPDVVEDVAVAGDGDGADDHRDQDADADGREGRAGAGPVAREVAQGQADGDGRFASDPGQQGEEER